MFPQQPRKIAPWIASVVAAVFVFKNPERAAHFVTQVFDAIDRFAGALG